ncbi:hypothetical protein GBA52_015941 [Prunus armeniaca]|nr:hypothetical protein GBA52_015941 [Prunus armeniaca]
MVIDKIVALLVQRCLGQELKHRAELWSSYLAFSACFCKVKEAHHGTEYVVGDDKGWDLYPEVCNWGKDKHFKAGDVLVFKYSNPLFSVAAVDAKGYQCCKSKGHLKKLYNSGDDHVVLKKGQNYFICNVIDYCGYGMRISVHAE